MIVRYALMNRNSEPVGQDTFAHAFRGVPGLTPVDAKVIGNPESGMLVRKLTLDQALALQANLKAVGSHTEVVPEIALPVLAESKIVRSLEFSAETLTLRDVMQQSTTIANQDFKLLAAGSVRTAAFSRRRIETQEVRAHTLHIPIHAFPLMIPIVQHETRVQYIARESEEWVLRAEIMVVNQRFVIEGENFDYGCLGSAMTQDTATNFCLLVHELAGKFSPPLISRGVRSILADPPDFAYYPNKDAFDNELLWLLWREATMLAGNEQESCSNS
jgi:hypothetical protein